MQADYSGAKGGCQFFRRDIVQSTLIESIITRRGSRAKCVQV
jgi:hypothetical protein